MAFQLNDATVERDAAVHRGEKAESSLTSDVGGFNCRASFQHGQQGQHRTAREVGVSQLSSGLADDVAKLEIDILKVRLDPRQVSFSSASNN